MSDMNKLVACPAPGAAPPGATAFAGSLALTLLLPALGMSIANVTLPTLANDFAEPVAMVNWVVLAYLLALVTFIMGAAVLGDIFGRKLVLLLGIGIFAGASVMCALAPNLWLLVFARLLQGLGATFILSQVFALASNNAPDGRTGAMMGLLGTATAIGTALGPVAGGVLLNFCGWQSVFCLLLLLAIGSFVLCVRYVPHDLLPSGKTPRPFDWPGTVLLALSCLVYAVAISGQGPQLASGPLLLWLALGLLLVFLWSQHKRREPLIDLTFFRQPLRNTTLVAALTVDAIAMATLVIGPFYLTYALALSPWQVGMLMSVGPVASACSGYPSGKLVDLIGSARVMLFGLLLMAVGAGCFALLPSQFGVAGYVVALLVMTPGRQLFLTANNSYVLSSVAASGKGVAAGLLNLIKNLGLLTGASLLPAVFANALQQVPLAQASPLQLTQAFRSTFSWAALTLGLMLLVLYLVRRQCAMPVNQRPD